jgi:hypothetical protein
VEETGQQVLVVPVRAATRLPFQPGPGDEPTRLDLLASAHRMEGVDGLRDRPAPSKSMRLKRAVATALADVAGDGVQEVSVSILRAKQPRIMLASDTLRTAGHALRMPSGSLSAHLGCTVSKMPKHV